jgi:phosphate transport system substrate-binding protein
MLALAVLVGASACARSQHALTLAGSTSLQPYAERWADAFNVSRPDLPMYIQGGGSTAGVQAAISGAAQIGMASRRLTPAEAGRVDAIPVARDGLAIVVHPTNPLVNLTLEEARAIYSGVASNWRVLGGPDLPITVITREEGSGTRAAFEELVMHGHRIAASALVQDSTGAVRQMVASDPAAVGYISLGLVDGTVKAVALGGVTASEAEIDAGRYPLVRPFLFVVPKDPSPAARAFIEWVTGPEGRALTRREGLLPPEG